jgi:hypothetical protein
MEARTMTTQTTHTPGPWKEKRKLAIYSADDEPICAVFPAETEGQSAADAHLIAAAPDLLEALRGLLRETRQSVPNINVKKHFSLMVQMEEAKSAIAKAEGRAE